MTSPNYISAREARQEVSRLRDLCSREEEMKREKDRVEHSTYMAQEDRELGWFKNVFDKEIRDAVFDKKRKSEIFVERYDRVGNGDRERLVMQLESWLLSLGYKVTRREILTKHQAGSFGSDSDFGVGIHSWSAYSEHNCKFTVAW